MRNDPLREAISLDLVLEGKFAQARHEPPVPADDPPYHPFGCEVVEATIFAIALAGGVDEGEILRGTILHETPLESDCEFFREPHTDEATGSHGVAVHDHAGGVFCKDDLVPAQETPVPVPGVALWCASFMLPSPWHRCQDTHCGIMCKASPGRRSLWRLRLGGEGCRFEGSDAATHVQRTQQDMLPSAWMARS
jgi:hypothetical protein